MPRHVLSTQTGLSQALKEFRFDPDTPLTEKYEIMVHLFLEQAIAQMYDMSAKDAMIAAGIATDKMQLLKGMPTEIVGCIPLLAKIYEIALKENVQLKSILTAVLDQMEDKP